MGVTNEVKNYILEILDEKKSAAVPGYVVSDLIVDCYGSRRRVIHSAYWEDWEAEKKQGYYMG